MTPTTKPSAGAMKAAKAIWPYTTMARLRDIELLARLIDDNGLREMAEALGRISSTLTLRKPTVYEERAKRLADEALASYQGKEGR